MEHGNFKHGYTSKDRIYRIWRDMKTRCYNPNHSKYKYYGLKGITVCDSWKNSFISFRDWAFDNGYNDGLTIDRIDSNQNYCPQNCRWITLSENTILSNKTGKHYKAISPKGEIFFLDEYSNFCKEHNLSKGNVSRMINNKGLHSVKGWIIKEI